MIKADWRITGLGMVASLLLGIAGSMAWSQKQKQPSFVDPTVVSVRSSHVSALGTIAPRGRIRRIAAPSNFSRVGHLLVEEGDRVLHGQVIARSDDYQLHLSEVEHAEAQISIAQTKLSKLLAGPDPHEVSAMAASIFAASESYDQRKREFERASALAKSNSISHEEFEESKLRVALAKWTVQELESKQKLLQSVRTEDVRILEAELQAAQSRLSTAKQNLAISEIVAPMEGTVLRVHVRDGERPGESGILELGDTRRMQVIAEVYETDATRMRIGLPTRVLMKSSNKELHGSVVHVRPIVGRKSVLDNDPVSDADARVVEAVIDLKEEDSLLVQSLSNASVTVIIQVDP